MFYLSFDCANKSLGVSYFQYDLNSSVSLIKLCNNYYDMLNIEYDVNSSILNNIKRLKLKLKTKELISKYIKFLIELNKLLDSVIDIRYLDVINLLNDRKTKNVNIIDRSVCLKTKLLYIDSLLSKSNQTTVVIEYQMNCNDKSRTIYNQLIYHYSCINKFIVKVIAPAFKNKIYFSEELKHNKFLQIYRSNYIANKKHTSANFIYFMNVFDKSELISHIKKKNIDDISDSFIQALYIVKQSLINNT